jgi:hypothetical protein
MVRDVGARVSCYLKNIHHEPKQKFENHIYQCVSSLNSFHSVCSFNFQLKLVTSEVVSTSEASASGK